MEKVATTSALAWLTLIDAGRYAESWSETAACFQGAVTGANRETSLASFRQPLDIQVARHLKWLQFLTEVPGAPDGQYVTMQFDTSLAEKKPAIETVTFKLEPDGK